MKYYFLLFLVLITRITCGQLGCDINLIRSTLTGAGCIELSSCQSSCSMYFYNPQSLSGPAAQAFADNFGANLISVQSLAENQCIINALNTNSFSGVIWLGFTDIVSEGTFLWTDQSQISYTNWSPGEPNNSGGNEDCAQIYPDGKWNDLNCFSYSSKSIIEVGLCPEITTSSNRTICIGSSTTITCSDAILGSKPYDYVWSNGMTGQSITVSPNTTTTYSITATDRYGCYVTESVTIAVSNPDFTLGPDQTICPGAFDDTFTSSNTSAGNSYSWSTGETTPSITKNTSGQYRLRLTDANGCIDRDTVNLVVGSLPPVNFSANSQCIYDSVSFSNTTVGGQSFFWDFGDGNTSTLENPKHLYNAVGNYTAKLVATFGAGCKDSTTNNVSIFIAPIADFDGTNDCFNENAIFTNQSSIANGTITSNIWDFGDGTPMGNQVNESHLYTSKGNYSVSLIVVSNNQCVDTISKSFDRYTIPTIDFNASNECLYDSVLFTNTSVVSAPSTFQSFEWNFGDGTSIIDNNNPYHKYSGAGAFNVKLIGTTQFGCQDSVDKQVTIFDVPNADFSFVNDCYNLPAIFSDQSTIANGTITQWDWSFGDGNDGDSQNETHQYGVDGQFQVDLITTSNEGCKDTVDYMVTRFPIPIPDYTANPECIYNEVLFNDNSSVNSPDFIAHWRWSFGPGLSSTDPSPSILFNNPGVNPVKLVLISNNGCRDSIERTIDVYYEPTAAFTTIDGCNNIPAAFIDNSTVVNDNITTWEWDLGDGTLSGNQNLSHQYSLAGTYPIHLIVTTNNDCKDTVREDLVRFPIPIADYTFTNECLYTPIQFNNASTIDNTSTIDIFDWNFGDGSAIDQNENPTHQYSTPGIYQVTLSVTSNHNCIDDTAFFVEAYAVPLVNFNADDQCINVGASEFDNSSSIFSGSFDEWKWDFGDGITSSLLHPDHQYNFSGTYQVSLIGISNHNCSDTIVKPLAIHNKPSALFDTDITGQCIPFCANLSDLSTDDYGLNFWEWEIENNADRFEQNPEICLDQDGEYDVSLIVTNLFNCKDTVSQSDLISAWPNPIANFDLSEEIADVITPFIVMTNTSFDAENWKWNLGNGKVDSLNYDIKETYPTMGDYNIDLAVENQYGCRDSINKELKVLSRSFHYVPNSFTPNGDGINDVFKIEYEDLNFINLGVYDRWGKQLFFTEDIDQPWDGKFNGKQLKTATFAWILKYKNKQNNDIVEKGSVTLIK